MTSLRKFEKIIDWYADVCTTDVRTLLQQEDHERIEHVEVLLGERFPSELSELYRSYDGEDGSGAGAFLGHSFIGLMPMVDQLEFCRSLIKPENPMLENVAQSAQIVDDIIDVYKRAMPPKKILGLFEARWHKLEFSCSPNSMGGPYFYESSDTSERERSILDLSDDSQDKIRKLSRQLHDLERESYNWDELQVTIYKNGKADIKRTFFDFDNELPLASFPADAMRIKYFHIKWLPVIHDGGGNYIGVDLDPGPKGTTGQVIVFGRDEEDMFVLASSWEGFLDLVLSKIDDGGEAFKSCLHLHDYFREELVES